MKIKKEHFKELEEVINNIHISDWRKYYKEKGLSKERFIWDMFYLSKFDCNILYDYLNDSHIQTALSKIISKY